jgi:hypothetical protein
MSAIEWDVEGFYRNINFFKNNENWVEILAVAAANIQDEIRDDAETILYSQVNRKTGSIGNSIETTVDISDDDVTFSVGCSHPAAAMIEYGGLVPTGDSKKAFSNVDAYADNPFAFSNAIKKNQPFKQAQPFLRPALDAGKDNLNSEINLVFHQYFK